MTDLTTPRRTLFGTTAALLGTALLPAVCPREAVAAGDGDDAELIRVCAQHIQNHRAYNADTSGLECDVNPLWYAYHASYEFIEEAEPTTINGIVAKAFVAKLEGSHPDGSFGSLAPWSDDLVFDLVRLAEDGVIARDVPAMMEG